MLHKIALTGAAPARQRPFPPWPQPGPDVEKRLSDAVNSGHWWQSGGGTSEELERSLSAWFRVRHAVGVMNGTVALEVALRALGVGVGDEVLLPATTFVSTAFAVAIVGATPVPVDIDPRTYNIDMDLAADFCTARTRALIIVHLAGQPADLSAARRVCDAMSIALIEDSAQAIGGVWDSQRVGGAGDLTTLSFQASKLLPAGEGGAVLVKNDDTLIDRVERIANCGRPRGSGSYDHSILGTNARISEFNAAVVLAQIPSYEQFWRQRNVAMQRLTSSPAASELVDTDSRVTRHDLYMLMLRVRSELVEGGISNHTIVAALAAEGIPCQVIYPHWTSLPAFAHLVDHRARHCPVSETATAEGIWMHHRLLLDETFPDEFPEVWQRIMESADDLLAWQEST